MKHSYAAVLSALCLISLQQLSAQCGPTIICPANVTVNNTPGNCGAVVTYAPASATTTCTSTTTIFTETFQSGIGAWTMNVNTGANAASNPNTWEVNDSEGGVAPPGCGVASNGDLTLHITCTSAFCGSLITGAVYNASKLTNKRVESPVINSTGYSNLTLNFNYISNGDALLDNASVIYNDGTGWQTLTASIKSTVCGSGQGMWTAYSAALPASCNNNPALQIGFNWTNNADNVGTDPSVAINDITITANGAAAPTIAYSHASGSNFPVGTTTVTAIATDATLAADTCTFTVTVNDTEAPAFTSCPSNTTVPANNAGCTAIVNWTSAVATDNCPGTTLSSNFVSGSAFPLGTTTVTYTATDNSGNSSTCSFTITVVSSADFNIVSTMESIECEGSKDTLIATGGTSYLWSTGATTDSIVVTHIPGVTQWWVNGTDANGCTDSDTISVTVSALTAITLNMSSVDTQCVANASVNLAGAGSPVGGTWTGPGVTGLTFDPAVAGTGTHMLTYAVANGDSCMSYSTGTIYVDNCLGLSNLQNTDAFALYPNPNNGNFVIESKTNAVAEIFSSNGALVMSQNVFAGRNNLSLDSFTDGIYLVKISDGTSVKVIRMVLQQ